MSSPEKTNRPAGACWTPQETPSPPSSPTRHCPSRFELRTDEGFNRIHEDIRSLDTKIDSKFDGLRLETKSEFAAVRSELASLHRLVVQLTGGIIFTIMATEIASRL
jgi:hypothetical protein